MQLLSPLMVMQDFYNVVFPPSAYERVIQGQAKSDTVVGEGSYSPLTWEERRVFSTDSGSWSIQVLLIIHREVIRIMVKIMIMGQEYIILKTSYSLRVSLLRIK